MVNAGDSFYLKFWVNLPRWDEIALSNEPKMNIVRCPRAFQRVAQKRSVQNLNNKLR